MSADGGVGAKPRLDRWLLVLLIEAAILFGVLAATGALSGAFSLTLALARRSHAP